MKSLAAIASLVLTPSKWFAAFTRALVVAAPLAVSGMSAPAQAQSCTGNWLYHAPDQQRPGLDLYNNRTPDCVIGWDPDGPGPQQEWTIVGGFLDQVGNTPVANIGAFDGTQWRAMGAGFNQRVRALAVLNGELYAGGFFTASGATPIAGIARWNGTAWQPLSGPGLSVNAMHVWNNQLVLSTNSSFTYTWNGANLVFLGGANAAIYAFTTYNGQLIAATGIGLQSWNGSTWVGFANGVPSNGTSITSLAVLGTDLIVAGSFTSVAGVPANRIARWNGTAWSALGSGINQTVNSLEVLGNEVFACGNFSNAGGVSVSNVARWNGTTWNATSSGLVNEGSPVDMAVVRGRINVVGNFTHSLDGISMPGIATWNAGENLWQSVSSSFDSSVDGFAEFQGSLYGCGRFTRAGGIDAQSIAKWDGLTWQAVGNYPLRNTYSLTVYNGELIAAGAILNPDLSLTHRVIRFDGTNWLPLTDEASSTFDSFATELIVYNGDLYVAGRFTVAGGVAANRIARWNASNWSPLQQGLTGVFGNQGEVFAACLAIFNNELYVGGAFRNVGSITNVNHVARWNGTTWSRAGTLNGWSSFAFVSALVPFNGELYATGNALFSPGIEIGRWNGSTWTALSGGLGGANNGGSVGGRSMCVHNNKLYVGGVFNQAGSFNSFKLARYTGTAWQTVGTQGLGFNPGNRDTVTALASYKGEVLIGGIFPAIDAGTFTGGTGSGNFARFTETNIPWIARQPQNQAVCADQTAAFNSDAATGYTGLTYRWQIEPVIGSGSYVDIASNIVPGVATVTGANTPTLTIATTTSSVGLHTYNVRMIAATLCGNVTSTPAQLSITAPPVITQQPQTVIVSCPGAPVFSAPMSVLVGPTSVPYTLQWQIEDPAVQDGWRTLASTVGPAPLLLSNGVTCGTYQLDGQSLRFSGTCPQASGTRFRAVVSNTCGTEASTPATLQVSPCDCIDYNADRLFPDDSDLLDFLSVLAGGPCSTNTCSDIDFNNDGLFPDDADLLAFLTVLAGGDC